MITPPAASATITAAPNSASALRGCRRLPGLHFALAFAPHVTFCWYSYPPARASTSATTRRMAARRGTAATLAAPGGVGSLSAPLVAGIVASAQQGQAAPFGFLNPALYTLANTGAVHQALPLTSRSPARYRGVVCGSRTCGLQILTTFDDESFAMFGYTGQVSRKGYSNMSGIGTPNGQAFIKALRAAAG
jgi:hypothetical protein